MFIAPGKFLQKAMGVRKAGAGKSDKLGRASLCIPAEALSAVSVSTPDTSTERLDGRAASWEQGFHVLLEDKVGLLTFTEFLKLEYSQENILFWTKVERYRCIDDEQERRQRAQQLYDEHLSTYASDPVNVDAASRTATEQGLATADRDAFQVPQKHIYNLMKQDSYTRFLRSPLYKDSVLAELEGMPLPFSEAPKPLADSDRKSAKKAAKRRFSLPHWSVIKRRR